MAKQKKTKILVQINPDSLKAVKEYAEKNGTTVSEVVRLGIEMVTGLSISCKWCSPLTQ